MFRGGATAQGYWSIWEESRHIALAPLWIQSHFCVGSIQRILRFIPVTGGYRLHRCGLSVQIERFCDWKDAKNFFCGSLNKLEKSFILERKSAYCWLKNFGKRDFFEKVFSGRKVIFKSLVSKWFKVYDNY